jgi:hypothetical protein
LSAALASESIESEPATSAEYQQIVASQQNAYEDLWNMSPSERERLGMNFNRDSQAGFYDSMPMPMNGNPWDMMMMGGYPGMNPMMMYPGYNQMNNMNNMNNMNMMYPGYNQMNGMSNCGCQPICRPCVQW